MSMYETDHRRPDVDVRYACSDGDFRSMRLLMCGLLIVMLIFLILGGFGIV